MNQLNAIKQIANTELQNFALRLLTLNVEAVALLTEGFNEWPADGGEDEAWGMGCAGFEFHFRGRESNLVTLDKNAMHPATLSALFTLMDAMTKAGFEAALSTGDDAQWILVVIG